MKRSLSVLAVAGLLAGSGCGKSDSEAPLMQTAAVTPAEVTPEVPAVPYEELLSSADELAKKREFNEAVKVLTRAIAQDPNRTDAFVKRAAICSEVNLLSQAIADMSSALKLEPDNGKFLNTRGYFLLLTKQYDRAERDFSDAIGLDLGYAQPYNNRGLVWVAQGNYEQAIKDFDNALNTKPDYLDAHNNRGFALLHLEKFEPAVESFTRVLELDPNYLNALTNRARAHLKLNRPVDAIADLTKAIALQPDQLQHYISRSDAYLADGNSAAAAKDLAHVDWLRALTDLNVRLARSPRDADAWAARARHLLIENRHAEAGKSIQNALAIVPNHLQALIARAELGLQTQDYAGAVIDCTEVLKREHSYETLSLRGDAQFALEKFGDAIADYESARRFDARVAEAYRRRAEQFRASGDEQLASADEQFAAGLEKRLTDATVAVEKAEPREMVIEQASYEESANLPARPAPEVQ
ncbi:tetratricopeptide repeat protein [Planctomicrobium sp. SH661]|uniref:tetratricopeptide repeat protein n=1 Tax=Planctomicrobium sp. SH661 TaxID=3448124 RepID=UPI003F5AE12A